MEDLIGGIAIAICIVPLAVAFFGIWVRTVAREKLDQGLVMTPGFTPTLKYIAENASVALALDARSRLLLIVRPTAEPHLIDLKNVLSVEVERVRQSPTGTLASDQRFGAVVRRWWSILRRVILRGREDASDSEIKWSKIALRIRTSDRYPPAEEIIFYEGPAVASNDVEVLARMRRCEDWRARLQGVLAEGT